MAYFRMANFSYILLTVFILATIGCASSTTKPESPPAGPLGSAGSASKGSQGEGQSGTASESNLASGSSDQAKEGKGKATSPSSLEQLKEGKSTATSGPLQDILFEFDSYDLRGDARDILKSNAEWLKRNGSTRVEVEGHSDERGTNEYNLALGAKRSQSARDYLVSLGISADRISTISYGEEIPVCTEANENCWRQNRRARFIVVPSRPAS